MERSAAQSWSVARSLALLAAIFAIVLGAALPSAVSASTATGHPVQLCSGDQVFVVYDDAGRPAPRDTDSYGSLTCAACLAGAFVSLLPPPPLSGPSVPVTRPADGPVPTLQIATAASTVPPRPPSTAPPTA